MLKAQSLSCRRGGRAVFAGLGFAAESGALALVTGPNGSGKSSLLRLLAGLVLPTAGVLSWGGEDIASDPSAHRARLHYIGHLDALKPELTVTETAAYWRALRGESGDIGASLNAFGLTALAARSVRSLSAGQRRRLSLTRLLFGDAPLWLLDEPATALDNDGQALLRDHIARHRAKGGIVIAASHDPIAAHETQVIQMGGAR